MQQTAHSRRVQYQAHNAKPASNKFAPTNIPIQPVRSNETTTYTARTRAFTMPIGQQESGVTSGVKFVTSTVGNTVGGVTNTLGGVVGALGRGVGETLEGATGSAGQPVARGISDVSTSIEKGANDVAGGVKRAGEGK